MQKHSHSQSSSPSQVATLSGVDLKSKLYAALFRDIELRLFSEGSLETDLSLLMRRYASEGEVFFYSTLPKLGKAIEVSLISGEKLILPQGWAVYPTTSLSKFLRTLLIEVFEDDGTPKYQSADYSNVPLENRRRLADVVFSIRQICMMWSKVQDDSPYSPDALQKRDEEVLQNFIARVTRDPKINFSEITRDALREARRLLRVVFSFNCDAQSAIRRFLTEPFGKHGDGAVAGGESPRDKWSFNQWPGVPSRLFDWAEGKSVSYTRIPKQPAAKVALVPKDFRGPRVICEEPKENQFAQQGLWSLLRELLQSCHVTKHAICFESVEKSRALCADSRYATIDLKDASDNLSLALVRCLLPDWVFNTITRFRSRKASVRTAKAVTTFSTRCFATMGSATCFPMQTVVYWAIALGTMIAVRDSWPRSVQRGLRLDLRVFGDDIIVPLWCAGTVCDVLADCGLVVNEGKTCIHTPIRESCGAWTFMGINIPIYRWKTAGIAKHADWKSWSDQFEDLSNEVHSPRLNQCVLNALVDFIVPKLKTRYNKSLQRWEVRFPVVVRDGKRCGLDDYAGLYAWYVGNDRIPFLKGARDRVKMRWLDPRSALGSQVFRELFGPDATPAKVWQRSIPI